MRKFVFIYFVDVEHAVPISLTIFIVLSH